MKFNLSSKTLYNLASGVSKVINSRNALPILNNFLFDLDGSTLTITGSDVENALAAKMQVSEALGSGKFCLDARRLVDLLKEFPDQGLEFNVDDETLRVVINSPGGEYEMMATGGDQYPEYKKEEDGSEPKTITVPTETILQGIDNTIFAVSTDDFHPQMMGILLDIKPEDITFVATDTRKLVRFKSSKSAPGIEVKCILPVKAATILKNVFAKEPEIKITLTSRSAVIESETFVFNCRFIKGNFPDYNRVIPQNNPYVLTVDRQRFLNKVRQVGVFVDPGFGLEKFKITNERLYIKSSDPNLNNKADVSLECEYVGPEVVIGFSAPYLIEICNVLSTQEIVLRISDPSRPGVFCPSENEKDTDMLVILMPMNVTEF